MLEFTDEGLSEFTRMSDHVTRLGNFYGETSNEYHKAMQSFHQSVANMIRLGGRVSRDGDFNLFVQTPSGFVYGFNTHKMDFSPETTEFLPDEIPDTYPRPCTFSINS
jgi:hypothetical protein